MSRLNEQKYFVYGGIRSLLLFQKPVVFKPVVY